MVVVLLRLQVTGRGWNNGGRGELGITRVGFLAAEKRQTLTTAGSLGVVVGGRGSVALLLAVMTDQQDLQQGSDEEKDAI